MDTISQLFLLFIGLMAGLAIAWWLHYKKYGHHGHNYIHDKRKENLKKIIKILGHHHHITNDDVAHLLHVSDAAAWRYLEQLEKEGVIRQEGRKGRCVYYRKV